MKKIIKGVKLKNIEKSFKKEKVLKEINLTFHSGNLYAFIGPNGSGKTVLLKLICGLYVPSKGQVLYDDKEYNLMTQIFPNVRALIEKPCFFPNLTGFENLQLLAKLQNKIGSKEILKALEIVNLIEEKDKKFAHYSLGMKQKLGLAQVFMESPQVMVLDEPFNGLDDESVKKVLQYLIEEKENGKIILVSSHIVNDLEALAEKIYYFKEGQVIEQS